jgi:hypothetical protein
MVPDAITAGMKNPFPGMNPWLEEYWRDVHARVLVYASEQLNNRLPEDLRARVDERLAIDAGEEKPRTYLPDIAVTESWDRARPVLGQTELPVAVAEPVVVDLGQQIVRHLEIVDSREHIVTAIELASPSNKSVGDAWEAWRRKREDYLASGINVVEIDLLRGGGWILPDRSLLKEIPYGRVWHHVCLTRAPWKGEHEFYILPLRERLPAIRIPLRRTDPDVALDLQALIDQCYVGGRYGSTLNYTKPPNPPLPEEEAAWAREVLASRSQIGK